MNSSYIFRQIIQFVGYLGLQLVFAQSVAASQYIHAFIYVGVFLLLFRQRTNLPLQLLLAFTLGLIIDAFYDTLGIHAFASVMAVYVKSLLSQILFPTPKSASIKPSFRNMGFGSFSVFIWIPLFIHHTAVFSLEAWNHNLFFLTMRKALLSVMVTYLVICGVQMAAILVADRKSS